ncbi:MAG: 3-deoxy-7-phosphoheptulonate synthase [Eubacteriales bacterium]|nr:3-deoxy-7-phosphoheptulonate synthase [Eubacteriales bacterium]MDD4421673.1 3-deoxy-7-phosphoheptulonate synthase [Eubacteriales bacterium]
MIVVLQNNCEPEKVDHLENWLENLGIKVHVFKGEFQTVFGLIGDTSGIDIGMLEGLDVVKSVKRISEPYKKANRQFHPEDSVITAGGVEIGGGEFHFIAGPCSIESEAQIIEIAKKVKAAGASFLRGGAYKPRTSPYDFQGLKDLGISLLVEAKRETGLPIVTEIMNANHLRYFEEVDIIQVGARNMQNFELLKELGHTNKTILLKRGLSSTIKELLMSAEYIMAGGNEDIILCERGIRTFETQTRNTLDISAIPVLREYTHLPIIIDPSHACGVARYVKPLALAAVAAGAHGVMIEVHNDPARALCDGAQSLTPEQFLDVKNTADKILAALR